MSIEQDFSGTIFSDHMVSRKRCEAAYLKTKEVVKSRIDVKTGTEKKQNAGIDRGKRCKDLKNTPTAQWTVPDPHNFFANRKVRCSTKVHMYFPFPWNDCYDRSNMNLSLTDRAS